MKKESSPTNIVSTPNDPFDLDSKPKKYSPMLANDLISKASDQKTEDNNTLISPQNTTKTNKVVPYNEDNDAYDENDQNYERSGLSLEKFEQEVSLTDNDSRYFRSESDMDESSSPNFDGIKKDPSLFCIDEEDEINENKAEDKNISKETLKSKNLQLSFHEPEKENVLESKISSKVIDDMESQYDQEETHLDSTSNITTKLRAEERFKNHQYVLYPDDKIKRAWDSIMSVLLIYVSLVMPFRVCFIEDDSMFNQLDYFTDACFYMDIVQNFFSVYHDIEEELVVSNKKIAIHYFTTWFFFDMTAIFPFDAILLNDKYNTLIRVARLPKLYRLVKVTKLLRMVKVFKEKQRILNPLIRMGAGSQRLLFSVISIIVFCHIACCFWYLTAVMDDSLDNWVDSNGFTDESNFENYIASFYWVTSTVVTVGYGDIVACNTTERIVSCFLMFVGVIFYSFTIGSLSSLLSDFDAKNSVFDQKLTTLIQIKKRFGFDENLYLRIKNALKYGHLKTDQDKEKFLTELPSNLRTELSFFMHKSIVSSIEFFKNRSERFIAFIGPLLKPIKIGKNEVIASQGDYANEMFFIKKGTVAIVIRQYNNFKFMNISEGYFFGEVIFFF